ncbi:MAG TPA: aminoglycoside phosphotransferase family protein [Solirubrobacterales bacterium]|nr:aminoglycoside phosphotransferase family protein [Solirubrobacterales bacterium]
MPGSLREAGDDELRRSLEGALSEVRGDPVEVVALSRRPFAYETSYAIDELRVRLGDGESLDLVVKDVGAGGLSAAAAATKPGFTLDPRREIAVYRSLLAPSQVPAPRYWGAAEDEGRAWLFVERVEGEVLTDVGEVEVWRAAAAWAARLDAAVRPQVRAEVEPLLLHRNREWHAHWIEAATDAGGEELARQLRPAAPELLERLEALPSAFVHGELYPSNVIVGRREPEPPRIAPVDWELAGPGPFALDLAALVGGWGAEERRGMCESFHAALPEGRRASLSLGDLIAAVDLCRLSLALQWIGWAPGWEPPEEHRHDWVAEAMRLLEEIA